MGIRGKEGPSKANKACLDALTQQRARIEAAVEQKLKLQEPYTKLQTLPGVARILPSTLPLEMGPIHRFATVGDYASYCRKVNSQWTSNEKVKGHGKSHAARPQSFLAICRHFERPVERVAYKYLLPRPEGVRHGKALGELPSIKQTAEEDFRPGERFQIRLGHRSYGRSDALFKHDLAPNGAVRSFQRMLAATEKIPNMEMVGSAGI